jgi:signal peptidase I
MIGYMKKRKLRKQLKEYLHAARHARHMREDVAEPEDLAVLSDAEEALRKIHDSGEGDIERAMDKLAAATDKIYPSSNRTGLRENIEVIIVALGAAMAIRAFFFQPFKIPTGSMQPTLNGITTEAQAEAALFDHQPLKFVKWLVTGSSYKEFQAKVSGTVEDIRTQGDSLIVVIGGIAHRIPSYMSDLVLKRTPYGFQPLLKERYSKGDIIVSAKVIAGDHILVNKMKYNFRRPERGDISVFDTRSITDPRIRKDTFYIKRMVGLPGEKIQIQNKRLVADGKIVSEPPMFEKIAMDPAYEGYSNVELLASDSDFIQLADDQYLMCGDNTHNSMDGRFFGGVSREDFQGPAIFVYWPFREHWGLVH